MAAEQGQLSRRDPGPSASRGGSSGAPLALQAEGLSKSFGGVRVLQDVSLSVKAGEIHGLVGSNGSGKSTLIKILSGYHAPDPGGSLKVRGEDVPLPVAPDRATRAGLSFVHQDLGLIPQLSVLENLRVGRFTSHPGWRISWREERATVHAELQRFELDIPPEIRVERLSSIERVLLAVVRAFADLQHAPGGVLLLDEPTAYLPRDGVDRLFAAARRAAAEGAGVVFVSHRLEEIGMLTNSVSVLRDGRLVGTAETASLGESDLVEMIVGSKVATATFSSRREGEVMLQTRAVSGRVAQDVTLQLHRGEVLGLTGLMGMGHEEVPYLLFGAEPATGELVLGTEQMAVGEMSPRRAMAAGVALLPGDRQGASGAGSLSVTENLTLPTLERFFAGGLLRPRRERARALEVLRAYDVRPVAPARKLETLSGGNQQKALVAKWLERTPTIFLMHEPVQGVDVKAREEIARVIAGIAAEGGSVLLASCEYEDMARICSRVLVFRNGRIASELAGDALTKERIIERCYATGDRN
ncbi:MAG TPA: sugar ABC transporter ATP-binding protein [Solirubrobacteraceae bacterium]|nr:sugar ABC transporter ATP-binding protein [Solirubrobacteraceae bacterium]